MKTIDIRNQPRLGLRRTITLTIHGIRYRLFRSLVTVMVITVAVAFLLNIVGESLIKRSVHHHVNNRLTELREASVWASRISTVKAPAELLQEATETEPGSRNYREIQQMTGWSEAELQQFLGDAITAQRVLTFFAELDYAERRRLLHQAEELEIFTYLGSAEGWERFSTQIAQMSSIRLPLGMDQLQSIVDAWPELSRRLEVLRNARAEAIAQLAESIDTSALERLAGYDEAFAGQLRDAGFLLPADDAAVIAEQARNRLHTQFIERSLIDPDLKMRQPLAARLNLLPTDVATDDLWNVVDDEAGAAWFLEQLNERIAGAPASAELQRRRIAALEPAWMVELAELRHEELALLRAQRLVSYDGGGFLGLGERLSWLVVVSLIVCTVGIANAMLMSVTERFREIATLKCLGALDGFIMLMFVLEACALGLVGGSIGALVGALVSLLRMFASFGQLTTGSLPMLELFYAIVIAACIGVFLAAIAAVYPSYKAARLAPMEAMRIE